MLNDAYSERRSTLGWILIVIFSLNLVINCAVALFIGGMNYFIHINKKKLNAKVFKTISNKVGNRQFLVNFAPD